MVKKQKITTEQVILPATSIIKVNLPEFTKVSIPRIYESDLDRHKSVYVEHFQKNNSSTFTDNDDFPVIDFDKEQGKIYTGKYIGILSHKVNNTVTKITINTGYNPELLYRMLDVSNDIYITQHHAEFVNSDFGDLPKQIIEYLFLSTLNKALINGIPCEYQIIEQKSSRLSGKICLSKYIKNELGRSCSFTQKLNKRLPVKEICEVIHSTLTLIKTHKIKSYSRIDPSLFSSESSTTTVITNIIINKAKNHKVLSNPLFSGYKKVLEYAEIILKNKGSLTDDSIETESTYGFLVDVSALWEKYLEKLLKKNLQQWEVLSQYSYDTCNDSFFQRKIIPDFVLKNIGSGKIVVLDAKFKQMRFNATDVDRDDFYQIAYYHSFFQHRYSNNTPDLSSSTSFLVYPLSKKLSDEKKRCSGLFPLGNNGDSLCVTGIYVGKKATEIVLPNNKNKQSKGKSNIQENSNNSDEFAIVDAENEFINELSQMIH